jgi:competence protein ComEA
MLPANARLYDVVLVAGGLTNHADTTRINLAAYIYDADHIHIPYKGEASPPDYAPITDVADPAQTTAELININTATADELEKLKGIGKVIANRIIAYRLSHGEFSSLEDLQNIQGISAAMVDELSASLTVGQ